MDGRSLAGRLRCGIPVPQEAKAGRFQVQGFMGYLWCSLGDIVRLSQNESRNGAWDIA